VIETRTAPDAGPPGGAAPGAGGRLAELVATLTGNLYLVIGTLVFSTLTVLFGWLPPRGPWVDLMARTWSRGLLWSSGAHLETRFATPLSSEQPYVFMANHESLFDIPALLAGLPGRARFLAKRGLFQVPVFGWALKVGGFISIDRGDRSRASESFADASCCRSNAAAFCWRSRAVCRSYRWVSTVAAKCAPRRACGSGLAASPSAAAGRWRPATTACATRRG
jgi:hypothetical protein